MLIPPAVLVLTLLIAGALGAALAGFLFWIWETKRRLDEVEASVRNEVDSEM
jgi:hypothetical protein